MAAAEGLRWIARGVPSEGRAYDASFDMLPDRHQAVGMLPETLVGKKRCALGDWSLTPRLECGLQRTSAHRWSLRSACIVMAYIVMAYTVMA